MLWRHERAVRRHHVSIELEFGDSRFVPPHTVASTLGTAAMPSTIRHRQQETLRRPLLGKEGA